jgi:hypothetical protein
MRLRAAILALLLPLAAGAHAQAIFKCTTPSGGVTYQETPCPATGTQKPVGASRPSSADPVARALLEREARRGDPLARGFVEEARERDRLERLERLEREERVRRERLKEIPAADEPPPWVTPWGWPGPPGLARPKTKPAS